MANLLNQDTTIIGLPAGCVDHDIHFTGLQRDQYYSSWENVPTITSAWDSDLVGVRIFQTHRVWKENESLQHKSTRWHCEILRKWTMVVSSKTWAGSAKHMWTCCPRQAWSHSSLTMKHCRVLVGNHHQGYQSPCISHMISSYEETSFPWTNQPVAWCDREYKWNGGSEPVKP